MGFNRQMLPANVSSADAIYTEEKIKKPIPLVVKRPPKLLETVPTSPSGRTEEPKVVSAEDFPKLRGFV